MWKLLGNSCCRARTEHNLAKTLTLKFILKFKLIAVIQTRIIRNRKPYFFNDIQATLVTYSFNNFRTRKQGKTANNKG